VDGNLNESGSVLEKRQYMAEEEQVYDENSGKNEVSIVEKRLNVRLVVEGTEAAELELLPILRLIPESRD